jgi:hypothetical protein
MSESPITPVIVGDGALAMTLSDQLFEGGVFAQGIAFPTSPATRRACAPSSRRRTRERICSSRSTRSAASVGAGDCVGTPVEQNFSSAFRDRTEVQGARGQPGTWHEGASAKTAEPKARAKSRDRASDAIARVWEFFETYTRDLRADDFQRVFTRETPEAWQFFARAIKPEELARLPWHIRAAEYTRRAFLAFTLRLSPARRRIYGIALLMALIGLLKLFIGVKLVRIPIVPGVFHHRRAGLAWPDGAMWLAGGFLVLNLLILLEVADRLTLKKDLEVAREIQQAMLPREIYAATGIEAFGVTRPANTVGGDLYDVLRRPDGRIVFALGRRGGQGQPGRAADGPGRRDAARAGGRRARAGELATRLNVQVSRHAPGSRFVTMVVGLYDPDSGGLVYVNAGQNPPLLRRASGTFERLTEGGMALGMFDQSVYATGRLTLDPATCWCSTATA